MTISKSKPPKPENAALAAAIKVAREAAGMNQAALAEALSIRQQSVQQWESGQSAPRLPNLRQIATLLNAPGLLTHGSDDDAQLITFEGKPRSVTRTPVVGTAKLGDNGYYEVLSDAPGHGDGWVEGYTGDAQAYALRVRGDSMHPAIRHGSFVVVEPSGRCVTGEYVAIALVDGRKMVKELVFDRSDEIVVESVNGNHRRTIMRSEIESIHPVAAVISASKWRPG